MTGVIDAKAKSIFDDAIELSGAERRAFLDRACAENTELRARVEVLLKGAETDDQFLRDPTVGGAMQTIVVSTEKPGTRIGPYKLLEPIGEGGFGSVFLAEQESPVRRRVALKIIKLGMDTRAVVARFEQERQALAMMDHPNIAKVFDAGATAAGRPYFVMELVKGQPITEYCDRHKLPIAERLAIFTQVCSAVQHAHTKGVIHRDLKPGNVLVTEHGDQSSAPIAKVIDFGIAKAVDRPLTDKTVFTEHRQPIGTPEYMSPEQAEGSRDLDTRTDVYSLGVVLYELLAGLPPFDPQRLRSAAYAEVQRIIREVDPPRPSTRLSQATATAPNSPTLVSVAAQRRIEPARLNSLLRGELDWIVMRALEKERSRRYESPGALSADVSRYLKGEAVLAAPPSRAYVAKKFIRRHRGPVAAGVAVFVVLLLGAAGTSVGFLMARQNAAEAREQADRADRQAAEARQSAAVAKSVNTLMTTMINRADRGNEGGRANITVREVMDAGAKELDASAAAYEPSVASMMAKSIGDTYRALSLFEPAERMMRLHVEREKAVHGPASVEYADALGDLGEVLKARGSLDEAAATYAQARSIAEAAGEAGALTLAILRVNTGALLAQRDDLDGAESMFKRAIAWCEAHSQIQSAAYVDGLNNLAAIAYERGNLADAEALFNKSLDAQRAAGHSTGSDLFLTLHNLAGLQFAKHDYSGAENTIQEELATAKKLYGEDHLYTADAFGSLSMVRSVQGDLEGAEKAQRESLAIRRKLLAPDHASIGDNLNELGAVLLEEGKLEDAQAALSAACAIRDKTMPIDDAQNVFTHYNLASAMERQAEFANGEKALRPSVEAAVTGAAFKAGARREWIRYAAASLLGSLLVDQCADPASAPDVRAARLKEAETLIISSAERLQVLAPAMGPKMRTQMVPAALERAARLYREMAKADPGGAYTGKEKEWKEKLDAFGHSPATGAK